MKMASPKIQSQPLQFFCLTIFTILVQVWGQNPNPNAAASSCGGVLELSSGILELDFSPADPNGQDFCMWVIKLPATFYNIRFQLNEIPEASQLNLYSQADHVAGQFSILPIATLTSENPVNSTIDITDSSLIVIWTPSRVQIENEKRDGALLSFKWDSVKVERGNEGRDLDLVGGVNYVEANGGRFSWAKPGEIQQTLLWVLNSNSDSLVLKIETDFEKCALVDPCLCSYFGVYEVYDNFLRAVSTECGRSSNVQKSGIRPRLVALGFVNPEFRQDTNHVTLSWSSEETEEGTTTTTITTSTTTTTTTEAPKTCSSVSPYPKSCSEIQNESGSNSSQPQNCPIYPNGPDGDSVEVLCDLKVDGGGWTVIQKRSSGPLEEFNQNWSNYTQGFGSLSGNFWLGLENIRALTQNGDQELRIQLEDFEGEKRWAKYSSFSISDASDFYRLSIDGYHGNSTAGNSMTQSSTNNGMRFSTRDQDNDEDSIGNCADNLGGGGWWWNNCGGSILNGLYREKGETVPFAQGIIWSSWTGYYNSLAKTEMKIRTRNPESA